MLERSQKRVLRRTGADLDLPPKVFNALSLLVEHAGELLDKDTLMQALWPGLVVEENNLSQVISALRRALGDEGGFIQTVPKRGFRFIAEVTALPDADAASAPTPEATAQVNETRAVVVIGAPALQPSSSSSGSPVSPGRRRWFGLALTTGVAASLAGAAWWRGRSPTAAPAPTLAVLPFKPLLAEGRDELLEIGMADSLIARLSTVPGLVVRSTGSMLRYAGAGQDPLRAARELGVDWVVDGTLQRRGEHLRATARLLRATDGAAAWSGIFDQKSSSVFDIQDQISTKVMHALAPLLQARIVANTHLSEAGGTRSTEAYRLYLTAAWLSQGGRIEDVDNGVSLLQQALAIDPGYALAWAELAWVYRRRLWNTDAEPAEVFEPANAALERALAVVPQLAQARAGLGFSRYWFDFDWPGAEREFRSALAINPNVVSAHWGLTVLLLTQGRIGEGFVHMRFARELDPMSPLFNTMEASFLVAAGRLAEARVRQDQALDLAPNLWLTHAALAQLSFALQQPEKGIAALRRAAELATGTVRPQAVLAAHLAGLGQVDEARAGLNHLLAASRTRYVPPTSLALVHAALGETAPALAALEHALVVRDARLIYLKDDPGWSPLRSEPRFVELMKKLKFDRLGPGLVPV